MKVVSVDDEQIILDDFVEMLQNMDEIQEVQGFTDCEEALDYITENEVDVAFLDIRMRGMDGITLAKSIKLVKPEVNIIFMTAYEEYSMDAMRLHASGYLMKPPVEAEVRKELSDLRKPVTVKTEKRMRVQCFGNFEAYIDDVPCQFKYVKTKELLAYLVDRKGAYATNGEILGTLWEDREVTPSQENYLRNLVGDLRQVLKEAGLDNIIMKKKGMIAVVAKSIDCDYYRWLDDDPAIINKFNGEYMTQYSWAEYTLAGIESR